jgi:hypothetical protein
VPGEDLGLPGPHGASQPGQLSNLDAIAPVVEAVQRDAGWRAGRCVDGAEQFLALPGRGDLASRVPSRQASPQPRPSPLGELLARGQQQLADAVQRIRLTTPVAEGDLLHTAPSLVDHRVGQPDGVEVVHHHGRMAKRGHQGAGIPTPGVQRDRADPGQPVIRSGTKPAGHRSPGAVGHQVQQPAPLQVDQTGDPPGGFGPGRLEEAGLIQPQHGHSVQASGVLHQRSAVLVHRPHHGRPANAEITSDRGDRVGVLADPPAGLGAGPLGQHRPRSNPSRPLGPGADPAGRLSTAPEPLAPGQHHWTAADRQVTHPDRAAAVELGPHPAADAADHGGRGLDNQLPFAAYHLGGEDLEAVQAEQPGG